MMGVDVVGLVGTTVMITAFVCACIYDSKIREMESRYSDLMYLLQKQEDSIRDLSSKLGAKITEERLTFKERIKKYKEREVI